MPLQNLLDSSGDITKTIEDQVKSVMVPYLETYDYSKYITKLDSVLVEVLKSSALENKKLLSNFKELMIAEEDRSIKVSNLFEKWKEYVAHNVDTDELEIDCDYGGYPRYESVEVSFEVQEDESECFRVCHYIF